MAAPEDLAVEQNPGGGVSIGGYTGNNGPVVEIPGTVGSEPVTGVGESAFAGNKSLQAVVLPETVTEIGANAFSGCANLEQAQIPADVRSIGSGAFQGTAIADLQLPDGLESIGAEAFAGCDDLLSVNVPSSVTEIGESAFAGCAGLEAVVLPSGLESLDPGAFTGCSGLKDVYFAGTEAEFQALTGGNPDIVPPDATIHYEADPAKVSLPIQLPASVDPDGASNVGFVRQGGAAYATGLQATRVSESHMASTVTGPLSNGSAVTTISDSSGADKADDAPVGTGDVLTVRQGDLVVLRSELVVQGDVQGTGTMSLSQVVRLCYGYVGKWSPEGAFLQAGDFNGDGTLGLSDVVKEALLYKACR